MSDTYQIEGPAGPLELATDKLDSDRLAVLCHPHSQYGGSMHDSVVGVLAEACVASGIGVIRFNFRSVGQSGGKFDQGEGEVEDVLAVLDWAKTQQPHAELILGGYSFGAAMALLAASRVQAQLSRLILVAPPIQMVESDAALSIPMKVIVAGRDTIVSATAAAQYFSAEQMTVLPQADHFFGGAYQDLQEIAEAFFSSQAS